MAGKRSHPTPITLRYLYLFCLILMPFSTGSLAMSLLNPTSNDINSINSLWGNSLTADSSNDISSDSIINSIPTTSTSSSSLSQCPGGWHVFKNYCWTPVKTASLRFRQSWTAATLYAAVFCTQLDARLISVAGRYFCVKDAVRLSEFNLLDDLFSSNVSSRNKRIMGNVGY